MRNSVTLDSPKGAWHLSEGRQARGGSAPSGHGSKGGSSTGSARTICAQASRTSTGAAPTTPNPTPKPTETCSSPKMRLAFSAISMRIFSGIQPTGAKHLGNYIGAIRQYVASQEQGDDAFFCIVDLHSITVEYDPADLREATLSVAALLF